MNFEVPTIEAPTKDGPPAKMNPEIKARWLERLRDPETPQGGGCLKSPDGYCCLGVLADIYAKDTGHDWKTIDEVTPWYIIDGSDALLGNSIMKWAGLEKPYGATMTLANGTTGSLPSLNDSGSKFAYLADLIEAQL